MATALRIIPSYSADFGGLRQRQPAMLLDGAHTQRTVAAGAGQDDAGGVLSLILGQGDEEAVDRVRNPRGAVGLLRCNRPALIVRVAFGGITNT